MNTELILYSQQLFVNPRFAKGLSVYGWDITGTWTKGDGKITKTGGILGQIRQDNILIIGVQYRLRFTTTDRSAGNIFVMNKAGGTVHQNVTTNDSFDFEFTADGEDLIFDCNSAYNGAIQNATISSIPEQFYLDLTSDEPIPFTFNIDDIFNLQARKTTWTKNFNAPGTANNHKAFGHLYKINAEGIFDSRIKARAILKSHGLVILDGTLCLDSISVFQTGNSFYQLQLIGNSLDVFSKMGESTIKDLDFSAYDHAFTTDTILYNWGAFQATPVVINNPAICFNSPDQPNLNICTDSYTSPSISSLGSATFEGIARVKIRFSSNHSFTALDEIHIASDNNKLNGTHIIAEIPAADSITLYMGYSHLTDTSTPSALSVVTKRTWGGIGYWYPLQDNGTYQLLLTSGTLVQGKLYTVVQQDLGTDDFTNVATDPLTGLPTTASLGTTFKADDGFTAEGGAISPNVWMGRTELITHDLEENGAVLESKERTINSWFPMDLIPHIFIAEIFSKMKDLIGYEIDCDIVDTDIFKRLVMPVDQKFNVIDENGQYVRLNDWLPGMKLSDFFISILNLFNLVIIEDKSQQNKISLVNRSTFYDDSEDVSWELNVGKAMTIKPANALLPKYYHLKYKDSSDFYNLDYNKEIGNITNTAGIANEIDRKYGDHYVSSGNQFNDKSNKVEVSFVPTVMAGPLTQSPGGIYLDSDKTISVCYAADEEGNELTRPVANRILIAGFRGTNDAWSFSSHRVNGVFEDYDFTTDQGGRIFPYAAHIDNVFDGLAPYHDLNFGALLGQYFTHGYNEDAWNQNCLAGRYWGGYLTAILNKNAKSISGEFKLSINDIYRLNFQNLVKPRGADFVLKLQKVSDWDINGDGACKCEFLLKT